MPVARIPLPDLAATRAVAEKLVKLLRPKDVLALEGSLGAGKTTFVRALLRALDISEDVPSPTFTLLQTYETKQLPVYHFDLYRLKNENELDELGWDDALAEGLSFVEWPERAGTYMPKDYLTLKFVFDGYERSLSFIPHGNWQERMRNWS